MKNDNPVSPAFARRLLLFFLREELAEEVMGDLDEKFFETVSTKGLGRARLNYWYQVFNYVRPFAMRRTRLHNLIRLDMFRSYFTIGWRNMAKHKMYSAINIGGFALGIAACMLLALYIKGELSYDSFYANKDRIYRVVRFTPNSDPGRGVHFPHPVAAILKENFAELEVTGHYNDIPQFGSGEAEIRRTDRVDNTHEGGLVYMSQGLLEVLEASFIYGDPAHALTQPQSIVITKSKADKYFPGEDPVGKALIINDEQKRTFTVTGVIEDFHPQSHLDYSFMMTTPAAGFWEGERDSWCCSNYVNFVRVRPDTDIPSLEKKIGDLLETHAVADARKGNRDQEHVNWLKSMRMELQPVDEIYLNTDEVHDNLSHGDIRFIWLFGSITVFILFIACINFVNLSTARSATRAKEVGIRKVVGSLRSGLVRQFLAESFMFSLFAIVLAVAITILVIPSFNALVGRSLTFPWSEPLLIPLLFGGTILIGLIAGLYPSFYLSAFVPAKVLKGSITTGAGRTTLRSSLVIFQFTISITLIIATIIVSRQMDFLLNTKLGFNKDRVLILGGAATLFDKAVPLKKELSQLADVEAVSITGYLPVASSTRNGGDHWVDGSETEAQPSAQQWSVDHDYVKAMGLTITDGRDFSEKIASDSDAMIINQSLARELNLDNPVGTKVRNYYGVFTVIGVVEDFHFESLQHTISPVSLMIRKHQKSIAVRVKSDDLAASMESINTVWKKFSPHQPIRVSFLDDQYARTYDDVKRFGKVVTTFASLAIAVACLGLFGLSAFMMQQRSKEISIRQVLGASIGSLFRLLTQNFMMMVMISFAVAAPLAWYLMNLWLAEYAYKITITADVFIITMLSVAGITILTIGYQTIKAAFAKPADNLRSE